MCGDMNGESRNEFITPRRKDVSVLFEMSWMAQGESCIQTVS